MALIGSSVGDISGSAGKNSVVGITGSIDILYDGEGTEDGWIQFKEMTGNPTTPGSNQGKLYTKDNGSGVTTPYFIDSAGTVTSIIAGAATADGDIILDVDSGGTLELKENSTSVLLVTPSSSNIDFQPQVSNKDIRFASQAGNRLMTLDSSDDAVKVDRRLGLGYDSITSTGTLNANTPVVMIIAGMSDVTGTLPDPAFAGQIKVVIGLNAGVGDSIVSYTRPSGSTVTKTIVNGTGLMFCSFDATGSGALRWVPLGDITN